MRYFILTIKQHEKLGPLLIPCSAEINHKTYDELRRITPDSISLYKLSEPEKTLVLLAAEYSDKELLKRFGKRTDNLKTFFAKSSPSLIEQIIRPSIEGRMMQMLEICRTNNIPLFYSERTRSIFVDDKIIFPKEPARIVFQFKKANEEILYRQTIFTVDRSLTIYDKEILVIIKQPCVFVLDNQVIWFDEPVDCKKLIPFTRKEVIRIPLKMEQEFFEKFLLGMALKYEVEAEGFPIQETIGSPEVRLILEQSWQGLSVIRLAFKYQRAIIHPGSPSKIFTRMIETGHGYGIQKTHRNLRLEEDLINRLEAMGLKRVDPNTFQTKIPGEIPDEKKPYSNIAWVIQHNKELQDLGVAIQQEAYQNRYSLLSHRLIEKYQERYDWFEVNIIIDFEKFSIPLVAMRKHLLEKIHEFELPDKTIFVIPESWFSRFENLLLFGSSHGSTIHIAKHHASILSDHQEIPSGIRFRVNKLQQLSDYETIRPSERFKGQLRDYQLEGFQWMIHLMKNGLNGCLADDMGLGKTLQTIALLSTIKDWEQKSNHQRHQETSSCSKSSKPVQLSLFSEAEDTSKEEELMQSPTLLVMPTTLIYNWRMELRRFAPSLHFLIYSGPQRQKLQNRLKQADLILTSYGMVRKDLAIFKNIHFRYIILDESQIIRNPGSATYQAILGLESDYRLTLSGTPIENSLKDLWSQLNFLNRGLLGTLDFFKREFLQPIETGKNSGKQKVAKEKLLKITSPFIMRRTKDEVAKELPLKTEQVILCTMHSEQESIYEQEKSRVRNLILEHISTGNIRNNATLIITSLNKLRQIACHPALTDPSTGATSGKLEAIIRHLRTILTNNHKVLIFSSYIKHLHLIRQWLQGENREYRMLTGQTKNHEETIQSFRNNPNCQVMLLTLKKGGYGLNLVEADYVLVIDPWWNPAAQQQAIDRAHRIGQSKPVFVYRFISKGTLEEKILKMQRNKKQIADTFAGVNNPLQMLTEENLKYLLES